jgi:poly(A) polymerase
MIRAARRIVEKLRLHGHEAFFAGGWVRDYLLRRKPKDIDIATSARPDEVRRLFPHSLAIGAQFGVIQVRLYGRAYEVATFRRDNAYLDGRHPSSVEFSGPEQDALRRDFTINGLFYDPIADRLIDYVRGRSDIQNRLIRTIGNASERFAEDKVRMLRAIRFSCNLGFAITKDTWEAIQASALQILQVSWERIRDELVKLLTGPSPGTGLELLHASGLLAAILPEIEAMRGIPFVSGSASSTDVFQHARETLAVLRRPTAVLAFGALLRDVGKTEIAAGHSQWTADEHSLPGAKISRDLCRRLRMSNEETDRIVDLVSMHTELPRIDSMRESERRRFLCRPDIRDHLELFRAGCLAGRKKLDCYRRCLQKIREYERTPAPSPLISGEDLIALGYAPGPIFGKILQAIEDLQLEGILRTREEALEHIQNEFPFPGDTQP